MSDNLRDATVGSRDDIELRVGARPEHLPLVRAVATNIAMRVDFDLDAISDLEMALDEACATLTDRATPGAELVCRFAVGADEIAVAVTVPTADPAPPEASSVGWRVLNTLADSVTTVVEPGDRHTADATGVSEHLMRIQLSKRRSLTMG
ncbi:ATP-binding protein [Haloechinothrix sp. LS1_15]|uniref:ATP-binding protein n=1 Tax=Haloechinothrix sp. LS1_15 TaxID=2652248 RepID=UPI002947BED7|nr:ATP-binding protein [Haloechinothrix sp. LS1_15]MDV6014664.1 ATP-binding protein [Haloechinothrix sp. LS1_15]